MCTVNKRLYFAAGQWETNTFTMFF